MTPRRGELWWVRQPARAERATDTSRRLRPYLVVGGDAWNLEPRHPRVTLCPLTGLEHVARRYDTDVVLRRRETGLPKDSVAPALRPSRRRAPAARAAPRRGR